MFSVFQSQIEEKIYSCVSDSVMALGYEIVRVRFYKATSKILQIIIDKLDDKDIVVRDCEIVSKHISVLLDVHNIIKDDVKYQLEISSPGITRPLTRIKDLVNNIGSKVKVKTFRKIDGSKRIKGSILDVKDDNLIINQGENKIIIELDNLSDISLDMDINTILSAAK